MPMLNTLPPFLHPESLHQPFPSPPRATSRSFPTFAKISRAHRDACLLMCFSCVFLISGRPCRSQKKGHMKKGKTETIYISSKNDHSKQSWGKLRSPGLFHRSLHCSNTTSQAQKGETPRVRAVRDVLKRDVEMHLYCKIWDLLILFSNISYI